MDRQTRSRRRGPRTFDRDEALDIAMHRFWRHGYEGVSLSDLTGAIGIRPPSLYAAFGNKASLYREALDRYQTLPGALDGLSTAEDIDDAVQGLFRSAIDAATAARGERGCMVSSGMIQSAAQHADVARDLQTRRRFLCDAIADALTRWLSRDAAESLARYLSAVLQGLSIQARDGTSKESLERIADEVIAGLRARRLA